MTLAIVLCGLLVATCAIIAVLLFKGADNLLGEVAPRQTWDVDSGRSEPTPLSVASVSSSPVSATAASSAAIATPITSVAPPVPTRIRLVSNGGRYLGDTTITTRRRVSMQYRIGKALSNFTVSHKDGDVWVYRRVGVERE